MKASIELDQNDATGKDMSNEELKTLFQTLPDHIKYTGVQWGFRELSLGMIYSRT